ncbi:protein atonal homolog 8 [Homalodisca vitripennis]|nr:protein atonal homolog 8 [Homalodisca vitripennis]
MTTPAKKRIRLDSSAGAGYKMAVAGFCSEEDEEDLDTDMHSPTDISEDSVEVKVKPISGPAGGCKSKRKCAEPRKFGEEVKRRLVDYRNVRESESGPFRPWSQEPAECPQDEPLSLVLRDAAVLERLAPVVRPADQGKPRPRPQEVVRLHGAAEKSEGEDSGDRPRVFSVESLIRDRPGTSTVTDPAAAGTDKRKGTSIQSQQRNYKNMTRERRIEANARERTRVHTISAAFDTLRRAVPAYSHNQKLSKLSVLRIACSYILTLSRVAGNDYSADGSQPPLSECVDNVSRTIQLEGKLRKKKDD